MQINNIKIHKIFNGKRFVWSCKSPDGRELETFRRLRDAQKWAEQTRDFLLLPKKN